MKCLSCGHDNREGAEFYGECGQALQAELVYPQCRHANTLTNKFCGRCGHRLVEEVPAPLTVPPFPEPTSFASGRYQVKQSLGKGGMKKV